jgi:hypothetical protein
MLRLQSSTGPTVVVLFDFFFDNSVWVGAQFPEGGAGGSGDEDAVGGGGRGEGEDNRILIFAKLGPYFKKIIEKIKQEATNMKDFINAQNKIERLT